MLRCSLLFVTAVLLACAPARPAPPSAHGVEPTREAPPLEDVATPPEPLDHDRAAKRDEDAIVEALVVRRALRARTDDGEVYVESGRTSWITRDAVRVAKGPVGIVPDINLLWLRDGGTWRVAQTYVCPWAAFTDGRGFISQELRLERAKNGALVVPTPVLSPVSEAWADPEADGLPGSDVYRIGPARKGRVTHVWTSTDTPLTGQDFADELRRRLSPPWSSEEERLFTAFEQLPGYPVAFRDGVASYAIVDIHTESIPASDLRLPDDRRHSDSCSREFTRDYLQDYEQRQAAGRSARGLDVPFVPTASEPLPPPLPGGSCRPGRGNCIEAWNGVETKFSQWCKVDTFDFAAPCPRERVLVVCESETREDLLYRYRGAGQSDACPEDMRRHVGGG